MTFEVKSFEAGGWRRCEVPSGRDSTMTEWSLDVDHFICVSVTSQCLFRLVMSFSTCESSTAGARIVLWRCTMYAIVFTCTRQNGNIPLVRRFTSPKG